MKHIFLTGFALCGAMTWAATETVNDIEWNYEIYDGMACIEKKEMDEYGYEYFVSAISTSTSGDIKIPSHLGGSPVTEIGRGAFYGCSSLTSVTIPEGVTTIGEYAFDDCSSLTSVTIPKSVTTIDSSAFYGCSELPIDEDGVQYESEAKHVLIGVTSSLSGAFEIPSSVKFIFGVFSNCTGLTSVTIPPSVTTIGNYTFENCSGLTSVVISEGVVTIGYRAFAGCSSLTSVTIPSTVKVIKDSAFSTSSYSSEDSLETIYFKGPPPIATGLMVGDSYSTPSVKLIYSGAYAEQWELIALTNAWNLGANSERGTNVTLVTNDVAINCSIFGDGTIKSENDVITHFPKGETKTLTAEPAAGYVFMGWSGDLISTEKSITLSGDVDKYNLNVQFLPETLLRDFVGSGSGSGSGGGSTSGGLSADDVKSIIADMIASGDLVNTTTLEEKAKEQAEAVVNEKVETKEIVTKQQIQDLSMKTPVIDVTSGSGTISFALQKSTNLSDENGWEDVDITNPGVDANGNVTIDITPKEDEDTAFYKFVVKPEDQTK